MTLTLAIAGTDGFLALADGLRISPTDDANRPAVVLKDDIKMLAVPRTPAVVQSSGRATYGGIHVSAIIGEELSSLSETQTGPLHLEIVAHACSARLAAEHDARPLRRDAGVLLVGYDQNRRLEAFRVDVPERDFGDRWGRTSVRPLQICDAMPAIASPLGSETAAMVLQNFDTFSDIFDDSNESMKLSTANIDEQSRAAAAAGYRYAGMTLAELRPLALSRLGAWLLENAALAAMDGVGGLWSVAEIRPGNAAVVEHGMQLFG